ncbi:MAG: histidine kinase [Symbiobacteriaceae bacterium]|jgi:signal transduction histidine kinase|nr:histidine kinase [Symbiobacteriaceae bacterium]
MKRQYSIRTWLVGMIVVTAIMAYVGIFVFVMITNLWPRSTDEPNTFVRDEARLAALQRAVETAPERWADSVWQESLQTELNDLRFMLLLRDADDREIYRSGLPFASKYRIVERRTVVMAPTGLAGEVVWYDVSPPGGGLNDQQWQRMQNIVIPTGGVLIMVLTAVGTVWYITRPILRPLRQLSGAARQIIAGDLDFEVPESSVREVNEFAGAFAQMRDGLKESIGKQAVMEQERRMFIAAMAHDLRTPLTSVRGYLEGIRDGVARTPEKLDRYVSVALEKTGAMERLVDGLFNYSKTEYLNQPPHLAPVRVGELVSAAIAGLSPQATAKSIALRVDEPPADCTMQGDRDMLNRVLDNLLDNALRHTPGGGTVTVGWRCGIDHVRIWVQDTGPGIPPEDLGRIFEPLYRSDKARSTRTGGAGLGLAIARRLVEAHGGTITAVNEGGARFMLTLPVTPANRGPQVER